MTHIEQQSDDTLSPLLANFALSAGVFYTGRICGVHDFASDALRGHVHLIRRGPVQVSGAGQRSFTIERPSLLFLPRPDHHRLHADEHAGADVVCGTIRFGGGGSNPFTDSLPDVVLVELNELPGTDALLAMMSDEAFGQLNGRQAVLDRLCEVLVIRLLRHCQARGLTQGGTLAGLADIRLAKVLAILHTAPARPLDLPAMAALAGMSRSRFAMHFHAVIGVTPADYLTSWRVVTAQRLLRKGRAIKQVAHDVGYGSTSALTRVFVRKLGVAPGEWLRTVLASN